jgi:hypothetical protein
MAQADATEAVATGTFEVQLTPAPDAGDAIARMTLAKTFHGDLVATAKGEMLSAGDPRAGTAGYVAMERVTGWLGDRQGSFALQHNGAMAGGRQDLSVAVVPGSATGALAGLSGTMAIRMDGGRHVYEVRYRLP